VRLTKMFRNVFWARQIKLQEVSLRLSTIMLLYFYLCVLMPYTGIIEFP
jgi:hypothetical protein